MKTEEPHAVLPQARHHAELGCNTEAGEGQQGQALGLNTYQTFVELRMEIPLGCSRHTMPGPKPCFMAKGTARLQLLCQSRAKSWAMPSSGHPRALLLLKAFSVPEDEVAACLSPKDPPVAQRMSSYLPRAMTRSLDPHHQELLDIDSHKQHYSNTALLCNCSVHYTPTSRMLLQKEQPQYFQQNICSPEVQLQKYPKTRDAF